jgi:MATE family multidrug resistance protein
MGLPGLSGCPTLLSSIWGKATSKMRVSSRTTGELKILSRLAVPTVAMFIFVQGMVVTDIVMVGQLLDTDALAAAAVANTIYNFVFYLVVGASSALDTFASQAWGSGHARGVSRWTGVCLVFLTLLTAVSCIPLLFAESISEALLGQSSSQAAEVGAFCRRLIPGMFPQVWGISLHKAMLAQNRPLPPLAISIVSFVANIPLNLYLIDVLALRGAAWATTLSRTFSLLLTIAYCSSGGQLVTGHGWGPLWGSSLKGFVHRLSKFAWLSMLGAGMMGLEAASFEVTTAMAANLGDVDVAAHASMLAIASFMFLAFPFGLSVAASMRVGNLLGSNEPDRARDAAWLNVACGVSFMSLSGVAIALSRDNIGKIFTSDPQVIAAISSIAPICALFQVLDGLQGTGAGALRGMGRQRDVLFTNLFGLWLVGVTLGYVLTFVVDMGLTGLWWGMTVGLLCASSFCTYLLVSTDWEQQAHAAIKRVDEGPAAVAEVDFDMTVCVPASKRTAATITTSIIGARTEGGDTVVSPTPSDVEDPI